MRYLSGCANIMEKIIAIKHRAENVFQGEWMRLNLKALINAIGSTMPNSL